MHIHVHIKWSQAMYLKSIFQNAPKSNRVVEPSKWSPKDQPLWKPPVHTLNFFLMVWVCLFKNIICEQLYWGTARIIPSLFSLNLPLCYGDMEGVEVGEGWQVRLSALPRCLSRPDSFCVKCHWLRHLINAAQWATASPTLPCTKIIMAAFFSVMLRCPRRIANM